MVKFLIAVGIILISIIFIIKTFSKPKLRFVGLFLFFVGIVLLIISSIIIIPAGQIGVSIFLGQVSPKPLKNGINLAPPYVTIVSFPTRLQELTLTNENAVEARVQNGLLIKTDCTTHYRINPDMAPEIYSLYAVSINELVNKILLPVVRTEIRNVISKYSVDELYSLKREEIAIEIENKLINEVSKKGIIIDRFLIRAIYFPKEVEEAIQLKLKAQQEAEAMTFKKQKAEEEAKIKIIEAKGLAEAQKIINSTLTPYYLQLEAIQAYKLLAGSSNTTFILLPTSPNATGIPLIINGIR